MKRILIIGAHYDDAELGAGGTAAKLVAEGCQVYKVTLTDNEVAQSAYNKKTSRSDSIEDSRRASQILGVEEITDFPQRPVCQLEYSTEIMQAVEKIILDYRIDTAFVHSEFDTNQDHCAAGKISKTAARHCDNILIYQSNLYVCEKPFYPTVFFDISDYIDKKREALDQYGIEHQRFGASEDTLFENNIRRNKVWGYSNAVQYAEGFLPFKLLF
ncbi:PIG-L deacetylase family protein [Luxibacter massiliensis]|uniref:PIG-L deacetylase family protein n=1 Tax=Luxibacter massiliensis TaxID=2219695 RepID=UPI000F060041|nr:PIG-L deacetylase family protein [Luxibacter massiliensis]